MDFKKFSIATITGGILWVVTLVPTGYYVGKNYPEGLDYLGFVILAFMILTSIPILKAIWLALISQGKKRIALNG